MANSDIVEATLCLVVKNKRVLLAKKTRKVGAGLWNGYGGGINAGEDIRIATLRELQEESGLQAKPEDLEQVGILYFHVKNTDPKKSFVFRVYCFVLRNWLGDPIETPEMAEPTWFKIDKLPVDQMLPADKVLFPKMLSGKRIYANVWYLPEQVGLEKPIEIEEVKDFD